MHHPTQNIEGKRVIVGLSGGVDSAVAALLLQQRGAHVQALHMSNWEDDDGYCTAASDLQDARETCEQLGITLHHVNFSREYRARVFSSFLDEYRAGRTPNPDVLCNSEIKFGAFLKHAKRLGGDLIATGHYARIKRVEDRIELHKAKDLSKDQSYFLHAVSAAALAETVFPLGDLLKSEVRTMARDRALVVHNKKDSTGICFIGERPFREFLSRYLESSPGAVRTPEGRIVGEHHGLMYYTLGQRKGLGIGGLAGANDDPWYVAAKNLATNELTVVQGEHRLRFSVALEASGVTWINGEPHGLEKGSNFPCAAKIRYRQEDQACSVSSAGNEALSVTFEDRQADVTAGQYVVFYAADRCLGGAVIDRAVSCTDGLSKTG